jgi:hypothetical protein
MPAQQTSKKAKGRKIGRNRKHQATVYSAQMRDERNRKRRMRRHLRSHPQDSKGADAYVKEFGGKLYDWGLTGRGRKRNDRWHAKFQAARRLLAKFEIPDVRSDA